MTDASLGKLFLLLMTILSSPVVVADVPTTLLLLLQPSAPFSPVLLPFLFPTLGISHRNEINPHKLTIPPLPLPPDSK
jgi:hypothetical protein